MTFVANGDMVAQALLAAEALSRQGIDVRVIDCHTIKPLALEVPLTKVDDAVNVVLTCDAAGACSVQMCRCAIDAPA